MVVAILKCFTEWRDLPLGEYELAKLAYQIERIDLNFSGGKQDQYASTFGGFNYLEFQTDNLVIVNPLKLKKWFIDELESSLLLYYTTISRVSASIIEEQKINTSQGRIETIEALHAVKIDAIEMKKALLSSNIKQFTQIIRRGWESKKTWQNVSLTR